jgi:hypothetical protein
MPQPIGWQDEAVSAEKDTGADLDWVNKCVLYINCIERRLIPKYEPLFFFLLPTLIVTHDWHSTTFFPMGHGRERPSVSLPRLLHAQPEELKSIQGSS